MICIKEHNILAKLQDYPEERQWTRLWSRSNFRNNSTPYLSLVWSRKAVKPSRTVALCICLTCWP